MIDTIKMIAVNVRLPDSAEAPGAVPEVRAARSGNRTEAGMPENAPLEVPPIERVVRHFHNWKSSNSLARRDGFVFRPANRTDRSSRPAAAEKWREIPGSLNASARGPRVGPLNHPISSHGERGASCTRWTGRTGDLGAVLTGLSLRCPMTTLILITATAAFLAWTIRLAGAGGSEDHIGFLWRSCCRWRNAHLAIWVLYLNNWANDQARVSPRGYLKIDLVGLLLAGLARWLAGRDIGPPCSPQRIRHPSRLPPENRTLKPIP